MPEPETTDVDLGAEEAAAIAEDTPDAETDEVAPAEEAPTETETPAEKVEASEPETAPEEVVLPSTEDLLRFQLEQSRHETERMKRNHDQLSGKVGGRIASLQQQIEQLQRGGTEDYPPNNGAQATATKAPVYPDDVRMDIDSLKRSEADRAVTATVQNFRTRFPAISDPKIQAEMQPEFALRYGAIKDALETASAAEAASLVNGVLLESLSAVQSNRMATSAERKTKQASASRARKIAAEPVGTGAPANPLAGKPKDPKDMTDKEITAYYKSIGRKGF